MNHHGAYVPECKIRFPVNFTQTYIHIQALRERSILVYFSDLNKMGGLSSAVN